MEHQYNSNNNCPICDHDKSTQYMSVVDHNVSEDSFKICSCLSCGLKYTNPKISKNTIEKYYKTDSYISHSGIKKGLINRLYHFIRRYQIKKKEKLISELSNTKSLLDIGCGTGEFINYCKKNNWSVTGVEPNKGARNAVEKNYNITVTEDIDQNHSEQIGVVTLWHALEHVYDLKKDLKSIISKIIKNGYLIIAVPNCNSYDAKYYNENWAAYDMPIHLYHFEKKDIENIASLFNLNLITIKPLIFDAFYISMLSERKKNGSIIKGFTIALISNLKAIKRTNHSSLIYILQKK